MTPEGLDLLTRALEELLPFESTLVRDNFPAELRSLPQWVLWRLKLRDDSKTSDDPQLTKVPYSRNGRNASTTAPSSWCSLDEALEAYARGNYDGIGFVFTDGRCTGIDLDHCRDPETGEIAPWAQAIIDQFASYTEVSPSGTGVHIFVWATLPGTGRKYRLDRLDAHPDAAIEIYDRGRYFTVTGRHLPGTPTGVGHRQDAVTALLAELAEPKPRAKKPRPSSAPHGLTDAQLIEKAMAATNGDAFRRLWGGNTSGHGGDDSAADLALCAHLAFWCGPDRERIDRLFRQSGLYREKWERPDYRDATIAKALEGLTDWYGKPQLTEGYVLIPGEHIDDHYKVHEVGTDDFASAVLERLPVGSLFRMGSVVGEVVDDPGKRGFQELSAQRLRAIIDGHVKLAKWTMPKLPLRKFVACETDEAGVVLAAAGASPHVPELALLVHHPVYDRDLVLTHPGWNATSGIYYDEPPTLKDFTPKPEGAVEVLRDLIVDFPFRDRASRQNVVGLMLTPVIRPAVEKVPFHLVMSPLERTGKGKLLDTALGEAVLGQDVAPMQVGRTEEEREKRITALILAGDTFVHLDNLPVGDVLDSPALASLATAWPRWRGRKLGVSAAPSLPNNLVVALSGNNPKLTGEITKRTVPIVLQPLDAHPEDRSEYVHPEAEAYARVRHRAVLEALTGLVEGWKAAGCPTGRHGRRMGGFEPWARLVGDILYHAGLTEWLGNYKEWVRGGDDWTADAETLVETLAERYGEQEVKASMVLALVKDLGIFPSITSRRAEAQASALGKTVLAPLVDRPVGEWIVRRSGKGGSVRYRVTRNLPARPKAGPDLHDPEGSEGSEGLSPDPYQNFDAEKTEEPRENPSDASDPSAPAWSNPGPTATLDPEDEEIAV